MARQKKKLPKIGSKFVRSQFEFDGYKGIKNLLPRGAIVEYEAEKLPYTISSDYIPDFIITLKDGRKIYLEFKGNGRQFDHKTRQKMIAVRDQNPEIDLRIVFYADGKIGPKRKDGSFLRQSDWAIKNKFTFAIREVPKEWFNE